MSAMSAMSAVSAVSAVSPPDGPTVGPLISSNVPKNPDTEARLRAALAHTPVLRCPQRAAAIAARKAIAKMARKPPPTRESFSPRGSTQDLRCCTKPHVARFVWKSVWDEIADRRQMAVTTVWDAFAGVGSDCVEAARNFQRVLATECGKATFHRLRGNIRAAGFTPRQVVAHHTDCLTFGSPKCAEDNPLATFNFDIGLLYFDPPWGPDYGRARTMDFENAKLSGENACKTLGSAYEHLCKVAKPQFTLVKFPATASKNGPWFRHQCRPSHPCPGNEAGLPARLAHGCVVCYDKYKDDNVVFYLVRVGEGGK